MHSKIVYLFFLSTFLLFARQSHLLFYCGTTMVAPMLEISKEIEKRYHCKITIVQGGSKDLLVSLVMAGKGDLFLPGNAAFIEQSKDQSLFGYRKEIGYNRLTLFVKRGNPLHIKKLHDLTRRNILTVIGNPETCSIGKAATETLMRYGGEPFLKQVYRNLAAYAADSRDMNSMFFTGHVELGLNWKAVEKIAEKSMGIESIEIDEKFAPRKKLLLASLRYSEHKEIAKALIQYTVSPAGKKIMRKYGFLDE